MPHSAFWLPRSWPSDWPLRPPSPARATVGHALSESVARGVAGCDVGLRPATHAASDRPTGCGRRAGTCERFASARLNPCMDDRRPTSTSSTRT